MLISKNPKNWKKLFEIKKDKIMHARRKFGSKFIKKIFQTPKISKN